MWPFSSMIRGAEKRQQTDFSQFTTFTDLKTGNTTSGMNITQDTAMTLPVVFRCVQINVETVSSLPTDCFAKRPEGRVPYPTPTWMEKPNDEQDWGDFCAMGQYSYELDGNIFLLKASTDNGRLAGLYVLDPLRVTPKRIDLGGRRVLVHEVAMDDGEVRVYPANAIIHMKGMVPPGQLRGLSPIGQLRETYGVFAAAQEFGAAFFGNGATLSGVIESPGSMTKEQADRLQDSFSRRHGGVSKSHALGVLAGGATWKPLSVKPDEAQFLETMKFNAVMIAHAFGVPPHWVTDVTGTKGYVTGVMAGRLDWHQLGLLPRLIRWERAMSRELSRPAYMKFNVRGLLRGDANEQSTLMSSELQNAVRSRNEWRELLDLNPAEGGDTYFLNGGMVPLGDDGKPDKPEPPPVIVAPPPPDEGPEEDEPADVPEEAQRSEVHLHLEEGALRFDMPVNAQTTIQRGAVQVDNHQPDVRVDVAPAEVRVENHPPEVTVDAPVTVNVPESKRGKRTTKFVKDSKGEIVGKEEVDE